ncbi:MAG TPA: nuclear transport factor 2 family protein, partial [Gammaproteobacteria bacterium]|nr:nuclear transport factor 2 family protein [Gammaproteobacteria bacterium]
DAAVLAYKVHSQITVDGESVSIEAADASSWVKRDGQWVCALHTEAILGDPFGRDRQQAKS